MAPVSGSKGELGGARALCPGGSTHPAGNSTHSSLDPARPPRSAPGRLSKAPSRRPKSVGVVSGSLGSRSTQGGGSGRGSAAGGGRGAAGPTRQACTRSPLETALVERAWMTVFCANPVNSKQCFASQRRYDAAAIDGTQI